ncbi:hypothetical protein AFGD_008091 [Aspergillus flavus]|nr:hypothetical protein AFGD_008091 [Aspergillus flavus]
MSQAKKALDTVIKTMKMLDDAIIKFCCGGYCMTTLINDLAGPEKQMKEVVDQVRLLKPDSNQETSADGAIERGEPDEMNELVRATFYLYKALETGFLDLRDNVEPKGNHYVFFALKDFLVEVVQFIKFKSALFVTTVMGEETGTREKHNKHAPLLEELAADLVTPAASLQLSSIQLSSFYIPMKLPILLTALPWTAAAATLRSKSNVVNQTTCGGTTYAYTGLEGYGFIPSNATDKYGDTIGGIGSSIAIKPDSWRRTAPNTYSGIVYALPDRGWNTNGTLNFQPRIHKIALTLTLTHNASAQHPSPPNLHLKYLDTILLTGPDGLPTTGLDADVTGAASYPGYPPLPAATYVGDGFGGAGPGGKRISLDPEGLAIDNDGSFWVSDEYGPYVYKFSPEGKMILAIQPPEAILPRRNGTLSFSAASPPVYNPELTINPEDPQSGRNNNQGLEALTISPDGKTLYTMMQSALNQEGGPKKKNRQPARLLEYDISSGTPVYRHEYVVLLPKYEDYTQNESVVASQSEMHMLPSGDFLVLSRDSGFGHGQDETRSVYRHADVVAIGNSTTDLKGTFDGVGASVASSKGVLKDGITPVEYCEFLDYNVESELAKFGLHNGGAQDAWLLNEKWESFALVPVDTDQQKRGSAKKEYFLFSFSDNDFMTQDGHMDFGRYKYADESGYNIDNQVLVFRVEF